MSKVDVKEKAKKAEKKPSALGPDVDLDAYSDQAIEHVKIHKLRELSDEAKEKTINVG